MKTIDRFMLGVYALIVGIFSILIALHGYGSNLFLSLLTPLQGDPWTMIVGIVVFLLSLRFLTMRGANSENTTSFVHSTANGDIHISFQTLESLAIRSAQTIRGLTDLKADIKQVEAGVAIRIRGMVQPDLNIQEITEKLQEKVQMYVQETAGVHVTSVT